MTRDEVMAYIRRQVDDWPPLTEETRARLEVLLAPTADVTDARPVRAAQRRAA